MASKQAAVWEKESSKDKRLSEQPLSGLSSTADMNELNTTEFDDEDDDELGGGLFSLDEEQPKLDTGRKPKRYNCDCESDAEDLSDDSGNFDIPRTTTTVTSRKRHTGNTQASYKELPSDSTTAHGRPTHSIGGTRTGALAYGTSLPVTIPAGRFWPPRDAVDSVKERDGLLNSDDENTEDRVKTLLPQRIHKDLYREMQAQARSIQAADDPERLFGERPQRRRYQTGEPSLVARPLARHDNAIVIVAASVSTHT